MATILGTAALEEPRKIKPATRASLLCQGWRWWGLDTPLERKQLGLGAEEGVAERASPSGVTAVLELR